MEITMETENEIYEFKIVPQQERYYNSDSNWGVYNFTTKDDIPKYYDCYDDPFGENPITLKGSSLVGKMQRLTLGLEYKIVARCEYNQKYNSYQYVPTTITSSVPKTNAEQIAYLKTQVTELQAKNILSVYPNIVDDVLRNREIDYNKIKGIGEITWGKIKRNIIDNYVISDILIMLQPLGVTYGTISKLIMSESDPTLLKQKLLDNPYIMTKIKGLGFTKVDDLALKLNPDKRSSLERTVAFIKHYLKGIGENEGHSYVSEEILDNAIKDNVPECYDIYADFKQQQKNNGRFLYIENHRIGLKIQYDSEMNIYKILKYLDSQKSDFKIDIQKGIKQAEKEQGFNYSEEQIDEINKACKNQVVLISGMAGTGKTSVLRGVVKIYENYSIAACALSAKAAIRITEATGIKSSTIHRLLGYDGKGGFMYNIENKLPQEIVILDEASMVNTDIFYALISAVNEGSKVIIVGDYGQLPPIGCGNIFHDLIKMNCFTQCKLTKILRQAEKSGIISDSAKIRAGENPLKKPELKTVTGELQDMTYMFRENKEGMRDLAIKLYCKAVKKDGLDETIILTPCKQHRTNSSFEINQIIQDIIIPKDTANEVKFGNKTFRVGAKVIQRANNYDKNVFNGEMGYITDINEKNVDGKKTKVIVVEFPNKTIEFTQSELANIELAYCLTCHLTQGSGFKNNIVIIDSSHYMLLDRCMLYTAITRAKSKCVLIAEPCAFQRCLKNQASERNTWLSIMNVNDSVKAEL